MRNLESVSLADSALEKGSLINKIVVKERRSTHSTFDDFRNVSLKQFVKIRRLNIQFAYELQSRGQRRTKKKEVRLLNCTRLSSVELIWGGRGRRLSRVNHNRKYRSVSGLYRGLGSPDLLMDESHNPMVFQAGKR